MKTALMGIDLGTSSVKVITTDTKGKVLAKASEQFEIHIPEPGYAEEKPHIWWQQTVSCIRKNIDEISGSDREISAISFSGQMHGLVAVDRHGEPVCDAIIWSDGRSGQVIRDFITKTREDRYFAVTANMPVSGFLLFSLLWLKQHRPEIYHKIDRVMLPKDYIRYKLTGIIATEPSDAGASGCYHLSAHTWSAELIRAAGITEQIFPPLIRSSQIAGYVTPEAAAHTRLPAETPVVAGGGDSMMQMLGNGAVEDGHFVSNIGTGSQITCVKKGIPQKADRRVNTFPHIREGYYSIAGSSLNGGGVLRWLQETLLEQYTFPQITDLARQAHPGCNGLIFIPYLSGERTPHMDEKIRGGFEGLGLYHQKSDIARAVMEGIIFALKDCLTCVETVTQTTPTRITASGGGANSPFLLQLQADIFNREIQVTETTEEACLGAAMLAGIGVGVYSSFPDAIHCTSSSSQMIYYPDPEHSKFYQEIYCKYQQICQNRVIDISNTLR